MEPVVSLEEMDTMQEAIKILEKDILKLEPRVDKDSEKVILREVIKKLHGILNCLDYEMNVQKQVNAYLKTEINELNDKFQYLQEQLWYMEGKFVKI